MENDSKKKISSVFEWEQSFKKDTSGNPNLNDKPKSNSLGIPDKDFKTFLESWKEKNL